MESPPCAAPGAQRGLHEPAAHLDLGERAGKAPRASCLQQSLPQPSSESWARALGSPCVAEWPPQIKNPVFSTSPGVRQPLSMLWDVDLYLFRIICISACCKAPLTKRCSSGRVIPAMRSRADGIKTRHPRFGGFSFLCPSPTHEPPEWRRETSTVKPLEQPLRCGSK